MRSQQPQAGGPSRTFLFLEGPSSPIFARIADRLEVLGHRCVRINICPGNQVFWRRGGAVNYRGRFRDWAGFVEGFLDSKNVTDIMLLGEERPYHRVAIEVAKPRGINICTLEMGYFRPDWLTLELGGGGCNSHFPNDPDHIVRAAAGLPAPDFSVRFRQSFSAEAAYDLLYNLPNVFLWFLYPHYRRHALYHPLLEYWGWIRRLIGKGRRERRTRAIVDRLSRNGTPYFLFPLQLQTDYQIRSHSPFDNQQQAIEAVVSSFADHARSSANLVFKIHPLDNGLIDWGECVRSIAVARGVADRVHVVDGGDLSSLIEGSNGVVTINSTVGIQALRMRKPVKVLGAALYDIKRLTDQKPCDAFWQAPEQGDEIGCESFVRLLAASLQVRGDFYSKAGIEAGAKAVAERVHRNLVNQPDAYVSPPPRARPAKIGCTADKDAFQYVELTGKSGAAPMDGRVRGVNDTVRAYLNRKLENSAASGCEIEVFP